MSRVNLEGLRARDVRHGPGFTFQSETIAAGPSTGFVIDPNSPTVLFMTPGGAINVRLPASTPARTGLVFIICNVGGGGTITAQASDGSAFTATMTAAANTSLRAICTGSSTVAAGWVPW